MTIVPLIDVLCTAGLALLSDPVTIDGQFNDWPDTTAAAAWTIQGTTDQDSIYLRLHHPGPPRVIQHLEAPLILGLDLDDQVESGCEIGPLQGCELAFEMSPRKDGRSRGGVVAQSWDGADASTERSAYDYGFVMAPSVASRQHEIRIDRAAVPGTARSIRVVLLPDDGPTVTSRVAIRPGRATSQQPSSIIPRPAQGSIRVVSWNIEHGGMLKRADAVRTLLERLEPDVLLIQELEDDQDVGAIQALLDGMGTHDHWTVAISPTGSGLRTAVATRLPATPLKTFDHVTRSDAPQRTIRAAGLLVEDGAGPPVLAVSVHLKCCGGLNGREDLTRISEMLSIREAIAEAVDEHRPDGLIVGGDFNLVASPVPLDILRLDGQSLLGPDRDGDLIVATPHHLDGRDTYTWYNADSSFTPGRLDFILTGGETSQVNAFVLDTTDLSPDSLGELNTDATAHASDHLPVVVDVVPQEPGD